MSEVDDGGAGAFEAARPKLMAIAYRLLGSAVEAEDVIGDVAERWSATDRDAVRTPEAWLVTATTRRALDVLRSARLQRESYPGVWLPEPIATGDGPDERIERGETLTMGFLLLLERLTPLERAVFVLHDVLDHPYREIAEAVGRGEAACRQAVHRARRHVAVPARQTPADKAHAARVAEHFLAAGLGGDVDAFVAALAPDVVLTSDGGGLVHAAVRPVVGAERVSRFLGNLAARFADDMYVAALELNASPGFVVQAGGAWSAFILEVRGDHVVAIRAVASPPKLERLLATLPGNAARTGAWETPGRLRHRKGHPAGP